MKKTSLLLFTTGLMALALVWGCAEDGHMGNLKDKDGNIYRTVVIGEQVWMAENLRTTKYSDGSSIDGVMAYDASEEHAKTYGRLYTWAAATNGSTDKKGRLQGPCPRGWHMPTDEEWKVLEKHIGLPSDQLDNISWRGTTEGGMLKESGTEHWQAPNAEATDALGFTALPAGSFFPGIGYKFLGVEAYFWAATSSSDIEAWSRILSTGHGYIGRYASGKQYAFCIRCLKN
jgi:uncharacterized protein (TIGR02145 family)